MTKIDLNKLSFAELQAEIAQMEQAKVIVSKPKGLTYCIVRTYSAGVFAGHYDRKTKGMEGTVLNARRLWYWEGAASLSQLANEGVKTPEKCKFTQELLELDLKQIIEVIPCTKSAQENICKVKIWQM